MNLSDRLTQSGADLPSVNYVPMADAKHHPTLMGMMRSLYQEDPAGLSPGDSHFTATLDTLLINPAGGLLMLFLDDGETLHGYAILIPYWSNEFGGMILFADELYVRPASRGQGIARGLFEVLRNRRPFDAKVIALEVSPSNSRARWLYESVGFEVRRHTMMTMAL